MQPCPPSHPLSPPPTHTHTHRQIIDVNYYPVESARNSNMRHRPIGIGVQGLADAFLLLGLLASASRGWRTRSCCWGCPLTARRRSS